MNSHHFLKAKYNFICEFHSQTLIFFFTLHYIFYYVFPFQISLRKHTPSTLSHLPLLLRWYQRVQELPSVLRAAKDCGMALLSLSMADPCPLHPENPQPSGAEQEGPKVKQEPFIGGPRPTLTKLQVIEFHSLSFSPALLFYSPRSSSPNFPSHGRRLHMPCTEALLFATSLNLSVANSHNP